MQSIHTIALLYRSLKRSANVEWCNSHCINAIHAGKRFYVVTVIYDNRIDGGIYSYCVSWQSEWNNGTYLNIEIKRNKSVLGQKNDNIKLFFESICCKWFVYL